MSETGQARGEERGQGEQEGGELRFTVIEGETPRVKVTMLNSPLRVLGDAETNEVTVRAVKPNGEVVPAGLVAEVQARLNGEIAIKARPAGDIQRQMRKITKSFEGRYGDFFDNIGEMTSSLGEMFDTLTAMKSLGNNFDRLRLEITVPRRCDVALTTVNGPIQVGRIEGSVAVQSANGQIDCARIGGKLAVKSVSGNLRIGEITGAVSVQTASGDVATRGIDGDLVIQTMSGDAQGQDLVGQVGFKSHSGTLLVRDSRLNGFYLNTTSGECLVEAALDAGEYEVRTVSGDITLRPQPDLNAILSGRTVSGSFSCRLPYRHADDDWRSSLDDEVEDALSREFDGPEIDLPGLRIGKGGIDVGGFLKINEDGTVQMPGMRIERNRGRHGHDFGHGRQRERRRGRNRWEYLLGDPERANSGETRLRVRTVSGDLTIRPGRSDASAPAAERPAQPERREAPAAPALRAERGPVREGRGWPDSDLWPAAETGPTPPSASAEPVPPTPPAPPVPPAPMAPPVPPAPTAPLAPLSPTAPVAPASATPDVLITPPPTSAADDRADTGNRATEDDRATRTDTAPPASAATADRADTEQATDTDESAEATTPAATATAPDEPAASADQPDRERTRLEILEALRGGEITTDEALLLLRQLDA